MSKTARLASILLACMLGISACNLPSNADVTPTQGAEAVLTAAAQTVEVNLTQDAILNPPTVPVIPTSTTGPPTSTLAVSTNTQAAVSNTPTCNLAQFVTDVSIPDGTEFEPGDDFTKTWRLKNIGTCTWSGYTLVFDSGDSMGGPASSPIGTVSPGQEIDLSVDLEAPGSDGTYRGYWRIKNNSGVLVPVSGGYQSKSFFVEIKVKSPAPTAGPTTVTLNSTIGGTVYNPASNIPVTILAGDTGSNDLARGFMSFDISAMSGTTINSAALDLSGCSVVHDPFGNLSGIWVGEVQFGPTLDQADYNVSGTGIQLLNAIPGGTIDVKSYVQARASASEPRFQIRLHPSAGSSNNDNQADYMTCGAPKLTVTYQP
jgi:hypothetical protein